MIKSSIHTYVPVLNRRDFLIASAGTGTFATLAMNGFPQSVQAAAPLLLPSLPYAENDLQPVITANMIGFHYGKHHNRGYVDNLNKLINWKFAAQNIG